MLRCGLLLLLAVAMLPARAQKPVPAEDYSSVIKGGLFSPFVGTVSLQWERYVDENVSHQYGIFFFTGQLPGRRNNNTGTGFGLTYDYRKYLGDGEHSGFYFQPYARVQVYDARITTRNGRITSTTSVKSTTALTIIGAGIVVGWQWFYLKRLSLDFYAGPMYNYPYYNVTSNNGNLPPFLSGIWVRAGLTVGYKM